MHRREPDKLLLEGVGGMKISGKAPVEIKLKSDLRFELQGVSLHEIMNSSHLRTLLKRYLLNLKY